MYGVKCMPNIEMDPTFMKKEKLNAYLMHTRCIEQRQSVFQYTKMLTKKLKHVQYVTSSVAVHQIYVKSKLFTRFPYAWFLSHQLQNMSGLTTNIFEHMSEVHLMYT